MVTSAKPTIHERLAAILEALPAIGKDAFNPGQKFNFRSIDAILNEINPLFGKHGVFVLPEAGEIQMSTRPTRNGEATVAVVTVTYRFVADDGTFVEATSIGEGQDSGDKAVSKAMTMAFKTCLGQVFAISTEEDPDGTSVDASPAPSSAAKARGAAGAGKAATPAPPSPPAADPLEQRRVKIHADARTYIGDDAERRTWFLGFLAEKEIPNDFGAMTADHLDLVEAELASPF